MEPPRYEPITTLGKGIIRGFHFLDPLGGLGFGHLQDKGMHMLKMRMMRDVVTCGCFPQIGVAALM